jgi:hypothetical protein
MNGEVLRQIPGLTITNYPDSVALVVLDLSLNGSREPAPFVHVRFRRELLQCNLDAKKSLLFDLDAHKLLFDSIKVGLVTCGTEVYSRLMHMHSDICL